MKIYKKLLPVLILALTGSIFAGDIGSITNTQIKKTDLKSILTNLDSSKNNPLEGLKEASNPVSQDLSYALISKENYETIKPVLDVSISVLKMIAMYYVGQAIMIPAFGQLTGSIGNLFSSPFVTQATTKTIVNGVIGVQTPVYIPAAKLFLSRLGSASYHFTKFAALTGAMAYAQNKLGANSEKEAEIS